MLLVHLKLTPYKMLVIIVLNLGTRCPPGPGSHHSFFCLLDAYADADLLFFLLFYFIEDTLVLEQNKCKRPFKYGNKVPSRRWFSLPFFCLLNICANANWLSFDFIEHTLVPKQKLNEKNVGVFFNHGNKELSRRWFSHPWFYHLSISIQGPKTILEQVMRVIESFDFAESRPFASETSFSTFGRFVSSQEIEVNLKQSYICQ